MKILHVVPTYLPAVRYGGPMFSVHALCRSLAALGHEVHVCTTSMDGPGDLDVPIGKAVERDAVRVWYFRAQPSRRLAISSGLRAHLRSHLADFDVVHTHSVFLWPPWHAARAARRAAKPYVMAPRGMLVPELIEKRSGVAKTFWLKMLEWPNLAGADALQFTSRRERDDAARLGVPVEKAAIIANGFEMRDEPGVAAVAGVEIPSHPFVLYLGRINWKKGLDRLLRALRQASGVHAIIAGNDEEGYRRTLEEVARDCGVAERVRFVGPVYGKAKWDLVRAARAMVLPSHSENFGNAVLEAMAMGRPVIVTPAVGLAEAIKAASCGLVVEPEPALIAAALESLWRDEALCRAMGERGRQLVETDYSWPRLAERTAELYASIIEARRGRGAQG